ncbi:hypothetical protein ACVW06_003617 [Pantoea ananatis]|nr:hypothetical protein [Pantoea ananatis]MCW0350615.1 hypothetical protein [Pantoea ananatis]
MLVIFLSNLVRLKCYFMNNGNIAEPFVHCIKTHQYRWRLPVCNE